MLLKKVAIAMIFVIFFIGAFGLITFGKANGWPDWALTIVYGAVAVGVAILIGHLGKKTPSTSE